MKTRYSTIVFPVILAVAVFTSLAYADMGKDGHGKDWKKKDMSLEGKFFHKVEFVMKHSGELGLSDEQMKTITDLKIETKKTIIRHEAEIKLLQVDISAKLHENPIDVKAVNDLIDKKYEVKKSLAKEMVGSYAKLKGVLSKEQMEELKDIKMSTGRRAMRQ